MKQKSFSQFPIVKKTTLTLKVISSSTTGFLTSVKERGEFPKRAEKKILKGEREIITFNLLFHASTLWAIFTSYNFDNFHILCCWKKQNTRDSHLNVSANSWLPQIPHEREFAEGENSPRVSDFFFSTHWIKYKKEFLFLFGCRKKGTPKNISTIFSRFLFYFDVANPSWVKNIHHVSIFFSPFPPQSSA